MENSILFPQIVKHRVAIWPISSNPRYIPHRSWNIYPHTKKTCHDCSQQHYSEPKDGSNLNIPDEWTESWWINYMFVNYISIKVFLKPIVENIEFRESNDNYKYLKTECTLWRELRYWISKLHILRIIRLHILQGSWGSSAPISLFYRYGNWAAEKLRDLLRKLTSERAGSHMSPNLSWESIAQLESSRFSFLWGEMRAYLTEWQELKLGRNVWLGQLGGQQFHLETEWAETEAVRGQMLTSCFGHETSREARGGFQVKLSRRKWMRVQSKVSVLSA